MVVHERFQGVVEVRPGRSIFCKHWRLGNSTSANISTTTGKELRRRVTLICVHGTAANHLQFIPFLESLESCLMADHGSSQTPSMPAVTVDCWMYDAVGCGDSPPLPEDDSDAYCDSEQVQDLKALLQNHVYKTNDNNTADDQSTVIMGHSYGPNWIYKLIILLAREEQEQEAMKINISGLILVCSSLCNPKYQLQKGGPPLFRLPLWVLNCMQPFLTNMFLKIGFASATHEKHPQMIADAKHANNQNDMKTVKRYYQAHDWTEDLSDVQTHYYGETDDTANSSTTCTRGRRPLILHGMEDQVIPIQCGQNLANEWNSPIIAVPDASHMILLEQPDAMARHVLEYLRSSTS
jgi:pimeloyl-ACP methyl ester carboxylesterase